MIDGVIFAESKPEWQDFHSKRSQRPRQKRPTGNPRRPWEYRYKPEESKREDESGLLARSRARDRADVEAGQFWHEYRLVKSSPADWRKRVEQKEISPHEKPLPFVVEKRRVVTNGATKEFGPWKSWQTGATQAEAVAAGLGDTAYESAQSLHSLHAAHVQRAREVRDAQERTDSLSLHARVAAEKLRQLEQKANQDFTRKIAGKSEAQIVELRDKLRGKWAPQREQAKQQLDQLLRDAETARKELERLKKKPVQVPKPPKEPPMNSLESNRTISIEGDGWNDVVSRRHQVFEAPSKTAAEKAMDDFSHIVSSLRESTVEEIKGRFERLSLRWDKKAMASVVQQLGYAAVKTRKEMQQKLLGHLLMIRQSVRGEKASIESQPIEPGDQVTWVPHAEQERYAEPITGYVREQIQSNDGSVGYHLLGARPDDPHYVARVWSNQGTISKTGAQAEWKDTWKQDRAESDYQKFKRDAATPGVTIEGRGGSQYGGQPGYEVRKDGIWYYDVADWMVHRLESEKDEREQPTSTRPYRSATDLATEYRRQGMDKQQAWGAFVRDTILQARWRSDPIDARQFYEHWERAHS